MPTNYHSQETDHVSVSHLSIIFMLTYKTTPLKGASMRVFLIFTLFSLPLFAQNSIEEKLANENVDWNFTNTIFLEAISNIGDMHKINVLFPYDIPENINFRVRNIKLQQALNLFCEIHNLAYSIEDNALLIYPKDYDNFRYRLDKIETKVYDLQQISFALQDNVKFLELRDHILLPHTEEELLDLTEEHSDYYSQNLIYEKLSLVISASIAPDSWDKDEVSIDIVEGHGLVIVNTTSIHKRVQKFLQDLWKFASPRIDVKIWQFALSNDVINKWKLHKKPSINEQDFHKIFASVPSEDIWLQSQFTTSSHSSFPIYNKQQKNSFYQIHTANYDENKIWTQTFQVTQQKLAQDEHQKTSLFHNTQNNFLVQKNIYTPITIVPLTDGRSVVTFIHMSTKGRAMPGKKSFAGMSREEKDIRQKLRREKFNMHFRNSTFRDIAQFLTNKTNINILVVLSEDNNSKRMNLILNNIHAENVLNIMAKMYSVDYRIIHGAVIICEKGLFSPKTTLEIYDVSNFYLSDLKPPTSTPEDGGGALFEDSSAGTGSYGVSYTSTNANSISELIKSNIDKASWDDNEASLDEWGHLLVINQTPTVQKKINNFLIDLQQNMAKNYQRVHIWMYVGKTADASQKICAFTTSNRRKVILKSGKLVMGATAKDLELRRDFVRGYSYVDNLKDHIDKRQSWEITATPLLRNDTIEIKIDWAWRDTDTFKRHFRIAVKDGKTVLVTSLTPELNLYVGASIVK